MTVQIPPHFAVNFSIAIREQIRRGVIEQFAGLAPYWPLMAGFKYDAYWASDNAVAIILRSVPVSTVLVGNSEPKSLPAGVASLKANASMEEVREWVRTFTCSVDIAPTDGVVVVPVADSDDVLAVWDQWSADQREIWAAQVNELASYHYLVAQARQQEGEPPDDVGPLVGPTQHPSFPQPDDLEVGLWRYVSMDKLASLLETRSLWFSRADLLGDPHEGARSPVNVDRAAEVYPDAPSLHRRPPFDFTQEVYINCRHMADVESVAMWGMYTSSAEGIAIRTTYRKLRESLPDDHGIYVGRVSYVDYPSTWIPEANLFDRFMRKRLYFEYEREVRAVFADWNRSRGRLAPGVLVPVDLANLVLEIVIGPGASDSFERQVTERIRGAGLAAPIRRSDIDRDPIR